MALLTSGRRSFPARRTPWSDLRPGDGAEHDAGGTGNSAFRSKPRSGRGGLSGQPPP
jgi:hypothetical protein